MHSLQQFCDWKGIIHTIMDTAKHESNGLVERKIGLLGESVHAAMTGANLHARLWPEAYMAMCHAQNLTPSSALEREASIVCVSKLNLFMMLNNRCSQHNRRGNMHNRRRPGG